VQNAFVASNPSHFSKTIQFSKIGLQIEVLKPATQFICQLKGQFVGREAMIGVQITDGRLDAIKIRASKTATYVKIGRHQSHPMHDAADTANDHEFHLMLQEPL
jgi:hypothetical protein